MAIPAPQRDPDAPTVRTGANLYHLEENLSLAAVTAYEACSKHLHTGLLDWAVTDSDARACIAAVARLSFAELVAVVHRLGDTADGGTNLLAKLYERGFESEALVTEWRTLLHDKFVGATQDGLLPDLNQKLAEYQERYVPANILARGF
jgi:hypothetical protein